MATLQTCAQALYLRLLQRCLTREIFPDHAWNFTLTGSVPFNHLDRESGRDWPSEAETMVGLKRLDNIWKCVSQVIEDQVPGDLVEAGVWRGGCAIFMRALLAAYEDTGRSVWLADSFEGLPEADAQRFPRDAGDTHASLKQYLGVSLETVQDNFKRYELLDDRVCFLKGWFRDTLPSAPINNIAVLRLDGDMYESTYIALDTLYPKLQLGGFLIIDDYGALPNCRAAVEDYREAHGIREPLVSIDWTGMYWRKSKPALTR